MPFNKLKFAQRLEEVSRFRISLDRETDRGCALMAAAYLDSSLLEMTKSHLVPDSSVDEMFEGAGSLASFSAKIAFGFALGLISKQAKRDLTLIRKIRNDFAHESILIDFNSVKIEQRCLELCSHTRRATDSPRQIFVTTATYLLAEIHSAERLTRNVLPPPDRFTDSLRETMRAKLANLPKTLGGENDDSRSKEIVEYLLQDMTTCFGKISQYD